MEHIEHLENLIFFKMAAILNFMIKLFWKKVHAAQLEAYTPTF